jgi:hypothetical protein
MNFQEHLKNLQENFKNPVKGIELSIPSFWPYYKYIEKGHRILLCGDTGTGKTTWTLKYFIIELIENVLVNPNMECMVYYFSLENHTSIIWSKIIKYLLGRKGIVIDLVELRNPSLQSTLDAVDSVKPELERLQKCLFITSSINTASGMYKHVSNDMVKYGDLIEDKSTNTYSFKYHNPNMYVVCICDTINAITAEATLKKEDSVRLWVENFAKVILSTIYEVVIVNVQQFDNSMRVNAYASTSGSRIEGKHEPSLGALGVVKTTPTDHTIVLSLYQPSRYNLNTSDGYPITVLGNSYIRLNVMKSNFGDTGLHCSSHLYFQPLIDNYTELPPSSNKPLLEQFLTDKGIGKFAINPSKNTTPMQFGYSK